VEWQVLDRNVHCVGVEGGTFDDCQEIVKECFQVRKKRRSYAWMDGLIYR
jgi:threonine synthase